LVKLRVLPNTMMNSSCSAVSEHFLTNSSMNTNILFWTLSIVLLLSKMASCFYLKHNVSETGFCLRLQVKPTQLNQIDRASPYLRTNFLSRGISKLAANVSNVNISSVMDETCLYQIQTTSALNIFVIALAIS
jgi:hypothetical protein